MKKLRSILARLEALEQLKPDDICITFTDLSGHKTISLSEFLEMPEESRAEIDLTSFHVKGNNMSDFDRLLDAIIGENNII